MLTLLSPAKKMNMAPTKTGIPITKPRLLDDTHELAIVAKTQTAEDLKRLMHISDNLATMNFERFQSFNLDNRSNTAKAAGLAFDGDVYWGLEAESLSKKTLSYAQDHLRILSGLYGVLRPMDAIQPYRLEMGTKMATKRGKSLYEFWGAGIADQLNKDLANHSDTTVVNLASNEYFKSVNSNNLKCRLITPEFRDLKNGKYKIIQFYAKKARGLMVRYAIDHSIRKPEDLKKFDYSGYIFNSELSHSDNWVFSRN